MAKFDLEWLRVFDEVYATGSVSRAAERLGIAQATASIALAKLRLHFGDRLFSRTPAGMLPTPHAERLRPELQQALALLEQARGARPAFDAARAERLFRICMTDISEVVMLPRLINHLGSVAPGVRLEVEKIALDSPRRLAGGEVDLAVGFMPHLEAGYFQQTLFDERYVCMAAAGHPRLGARLTRKAFLAEGHIVADSAGTGHSIVDKVLEQQGMARRVVLRLSSYLGLARIVAQTELLVIVPGLLGETFALQEKVRLLPPPVALPGYAVKQHWHDRFHADPANAWLRRTIAELFGSRAAGMPAAPKPRR